MSTNNSINSNIPIPVSFGGTGEVSLSSHGILVGAGTSPVASMATGSAGDIIISGGASADPAFVTPTVGAGLNLTSSSSSLSYALQVPVTVSNGGTGQTSLTNHGVLVGAGTSAVTQLGAGTAGQVILSGGASSDPSYVTPTAGTGLSVTTNASTLSFALQSPVSVPNGGTGASTLTAHGLLVGEGTSAITALGAGTAGQVVLSGGASADPSYVTPTAGTGLSVTTNASTLSFGLSTPVSVADGGTGDTSLTTHGILVGAGTSAITAMAAGSAGQVVLSGGASSNPSYVTPTAGTGLSVTTNASTLSYSLNTPVLVANGGTGDSSFTAYSVLCGGTTSTGALQNVSGVGSSGQVLTSQGSAALPQWVTPSANPGGVNFFAYQTAGITNVTGNNASYLLGSGGGSNGIFTQIFNNGSGTLNLGNGSGTALSYVVPSTGIYKFECAILGQDATLSTGDTLAIVTITTTSQTYQYSNRMTRLTTGSSYLYTSFASVYCSMTSGDSVTFTYRVSGFAANGIGVDGGNLPIQTYVQGSKIN